MLAIELNPESQHQRTETSNSQAVPRIIGSFPISVSHMQYRDAVHGSSCPATSYYDRKFEQVMTVH